MTRVARRPLRAWSLSRQRGVGRRKRFANVGRQCECFAPRGDSQRRRGLYFPVRQQWSARCPLLYKSPSWPNNERPIGREAKLRARARSILLMLAVQC